MLYIDSYVTLPYVTFPLIFFSLVDCGYDEEESFEVSTKESRRKREREKESCKLQVSCLYTVYILYFTLPYPLYARKELLVPSIKVKIWCRLDSKV